MKTGILLINLGTPDSPNVKDVRKYLKEFLSDPRVIDIPALARWILVNFIILPFRPKQSAKAYQKIWQADGSPLLIYGKKLQIGLQKNLGEKTPIALGMRYGSPSIKSAYAELKKQDCGRIIILPLFPQYSSAATGSAIEEAMKVIHSETNIPSVFILHEFYQQDFFISSLSQSINETLNDFDWEHLLFSYHGLPERHIDKSNCSKNHCARQQVCPKISNQNQNCYRAQCFATSSFVAKKLKLPEHKFSTSFQSRLGKTPWIQPYTDHVLPNLAKQGIKKLAIACPAFVADCLETLEEIGIQAKQQWLDLGGTEFKLIPCLNDKNYWVTSLIEYLKKYLSH